MIIRKAKEKDIPRILELLEQVLQIHADIRPDIFIPGTTKYTIDELRELLKHKEKPIYVAVDEDDRSEERRQTTWFRLRRFLLMIFVSVKRFEVSMLAKVCLNM